MNEQELIPNVPEENVSMTPTPAAEETMEEVVETVASAQEPTDDYSEASDNEPDVNYYLMSKQQLLSTLDRIVEASETQRHKDVAAIKQAFYALRKNELEEECARFIEEGNDAAAFTSQPDPDEQHFKDLLTAFRDKRQAWLTAEEERRAENLGLKNKILDQLKALVEDLDNLHLNTQRFRELEAEFKKITDIPAGAVNDTWKRYSLILDQYYDSRKVSHELRELDFKKNLEAKNDLITQAEALADEKDVVAASRKLQALHDLWRETGPVAKELRTDIWNRFKEASTAVNKRHAQFFEARKAEEMANEEAKTKLCEEMEAIDFEQLKTLAQWNEATRRVMELQAEWKNIGFASRKNNATIYTRFRKANDAFFSRKAEIFKETKEQYSANLAAKTALTEKAEALVNDETDMRKGAEAARALMAEWKEVGPTPRKRSDELWKRFSAACNHFFDARKKELGETRKTEQANLEAKRAIIEKLKAIDTEKSQEELRDELRALQDRWQAIGHVPFKLKDAIYSEYRELIDRIAGARNAHRSRRRLDAFADRVSQMEDGGVRREQDKLNRVLEAKRAELKNYENNMGFFKVKSTGGNSMLRDMERSMKRLQDDIAELEKKISLLTSSKEE